MLKFKFLAYNNYYYCKLMIIIFVDTPKPTMAFSRLRSLLRPEQVITDVAVHDVRFPTSLEAHGSDAMHKDPDYSAAYVVITVSGLAPRGHGHTFTVGRGNEIICSSIRAILPMVLGKSLLEVYTKFGAFLALDHAGDSASLDWSRKGCLPPCDCSHHQRTVGPMGQAGGQTSMATAVRHDTRRDNVFG